jgi:hypothetical protein
LDLPSDDFSTALMRKYFNMNSMRETQAGPSCQAFVCLVRKSSALRASAINLRIGPCPLRTIEPLIAIVLGGVCGSDPPTPPAIAALLGRFLPRLGPLVATQAAFLFLCTPHRFRVLWAQAQCRATNLGRC